MNKLTAKLQTALKKLLSFAGGTFARVFATEIVKTYILTKEALIIALATLSVWLSQLFQFSSSLFGYRLIQTPIYIDITKATGALILLYFVGWFGYKTHEYKPKKKKPPYYFITESGVKWYVNKITGDVSYEPHCEICQCKLIRSFFQVGPYRESEYNYYCPVCKQNRLEYVTEKTISKYYETVFHKAQAMNEGFAKGFKA